MRKSQIYGQVFIYILTLVLISFILVYGYKSIRNFKDRAEQLSCIKFEKDFENSIQGMLSDFGTVKKKDMHMCSNYRQACFVESVLPFDRNFPRSNILPLDPILLDSVKSNTGKNAFLVSKDSTESFYAGKFSLDPSIDVLCISLGKSLRLEGKGSHVALSEWE